MRITNLQRLFNYRILMLLPVLSFPFAGEAKDIEVKFDKEAVKYDPYLAESKEYYRGTYHLEKDLADFLKHPDPDAEWITNRRKLSKAAVAEQMKRDTISAANEKANMCRLLSTQGQRLRSNLGMSIQKADIESSDLALIESLITQVPVEKDRIKIQEDLAKGKISKKLGPVVDAYLAALEREYDRYYQFCHNSRISTSIGKPRTLEEIKKMREDRQNGIRPAQKETRRDPDDLYLVINDIAIPVPEVVLTDTIRNPCNRRYLYDNYGKSSGIFHIGKLLETDCHSADWDWALPYYGIGTKQQDYPVYAEWYDFPEHPEYRVIGPEVYDTEGNLVRILYLSSGNLISGFRYGRTNVARYFISFDDLGRHSSELGRKIALMAYNNNEHDVKSASASALKYIGLQLGLRELTGAEKAQSDKATKAMGDAFGKAVMDDMKYGSNTKKGKAAARKNAANFFNALAVGSSNFDSTGAAWFTQIENDYWKILKNSPYKIERVNDTKFKVIYVDENYEPVLEITREYTTDKPYNVKESVSVRRL